MYKISYLIAAHKTSINCVMNSTNYSNPRVRTSHFQNSFISKPVNDWNNLDNDTRMSASLESFTNKLNKELTKNLVGITLVDILHATLTLSSGIGVYTDF